MNLTRTIEHDLCIHKKSDLVMRFERQKLLNIALLFHTNLGAQAKLKGKVGDADKRMKTRLIGKHVKSHTLATALLGNPRSRTVERSNMLALAMPI